MTFKVMDRRCDQCLYSPGRIVSTARFLDLQRELERKDDFFVCHKTHGSDEKVACRGDWDARGCGQLGRIAGRLGAVEFVSAEAWERRFAG